MRVLVETLQARIEQLERSIARYESGRRVLCREIDHLRRKLGYDNTHPAAERCQCSECVKPLSIF